MNTHAFPPQQAYVAIDIGSNTIMLTLAVPSISRSNTDSTNAQSDLGLRKVDSLFLPNPLLNSGDTKIQEQSDLGQVCWQEEGWHYEDFIRFVSLGQGMAETKKISKHAILRATKALGNYKKIIDMVEKSLNMTVKVRVAATSAVREAENQHQVCKLFSQILDCPIELIDGVEEGRLTFLGACARKNAKKNIALLDIGGGSTEITLATDTVYQKSISLPIGAVRWLTRYSQKQLADKAVLEKAKQEILGLFHSLWKAHVSPTLQAKLENCTFMAVAGVPTTMAAVEHCIEMQQFYLLEGKCIDFKQIDAIKEELLTIPTEIVANDKKRWSAIDAHRAEIMPISSVVFSTLLHALQEKLGGEKKVQVSVKGLRYGLLEEMQQTKFPITTG